jgi:hypothetical protein
VMSAIGASALNLNRTMCSSMPSAQGSEGFECVRAHF